MYFDGSLKLEGAGARVLLISPKGEQLKYVLQIFWKVSNNETEYEPLLHGLRLAISLGIKRLLVYDDSAVVINQVNKSWDRNKENMDAYCLEVRKLENKFYGLEFHHVMQRVPVLRQATTRLGLQASHHTTNLAFSLLGARHDWASPDYARRIQQSSGGHQQVHQVDRSQAGHLPKGRQSTRLLG
jgi:ribonuclease HI